MFILRFVYINIFFVLFFSSLKVNCQDLLAGEIYASNISALTYEITVNLYAKNDTALPRDIILLNWGDSTSDTLPLYEENIIGDIRTLSYKGIHTFPGEGIFIIMCAVNYRISGINNIPYSDVIPLKIEHSILVSLSLNNSTIKYLYPPYDFGTAGEVFNYWAGAYDTDGDSLSFSIDLPFGTGSYIPPGMSINPTTGDFLWNVPQQIGYYAIRLVVNEWRNNIIISSAKREMLIKIDSLVNISPARNLSPPEILIYPNPFNNTFTVEFETPANSNFQFTIYNYTSKEIISIKKNQLSMGTHREQINTEQLPPGIYLLKANINGQIQSVKIIKL